MDVIKWLVPNQNISKASSKFVEDLGKVVKQSQGMSVKYERLSNDLPAVEQISKSTDSITIVSNYEALYLESFYEFTPLFRIANTDLKGLVIIHKDSKINKLAKLENLAVAFPDCSDWLVVNPVILFILKKCKSVTYGKSKQYAAKFEPLNLSSVIEKSVDVAVTNSFEYHLMPEKERKKLKILGEFPILPEYVVVSGPDIKKQNMSKLKNNLERWRSKYAEHYRSIGMQILPYEVNENSLLVEAVEGLGFSLQKYVEENNDLLINSLSPNQQKEFREMEQKYHRLKNFNEKLVKMYQEVRDSRDRLTKEIEQATDNSILFLKDGTVLGCSRAFNTLIKYSRQDLIGQEIVKFIKPNLNTPFKKLIQQIDVGLVRSFVVSLLLADGSEREAKMEFSIIELMDSKVILGVLSNPDKT